LKIRYQFAFNVLAASGLVAASSNQVEAQAETVDEALEQTFALDAVKARLAEEERSRPSSYPHDSASSQQMTPPPISK
jgi:hypothetical protein